MPSVSRRVPALSLAVGTVAAIAIWLAMPAASAQSGSGQRPARDRDLFVTVTDDKGTPVTDLRPQEFVIREDGMRREVLSAQRATEPVTIALMVDNSQFTEPYLGDIRRALKTFVERMGGKHPMAVTTVAERPTILVDYTLDKKALLAATERVFPIPNSGSTFLEGLRELSKGLAGREAERAAIVAITAEGPELSDRHFTEVLPTLRTSGASLEVLVITRPGGADMGEEGARNRAFLIDAGSRETGGGRVDLLTSMSLGPALERLAAQLENQYRVTYARPESLIPPEKIEASVTRPGLSARGTPARTIR
ncbi:MAG: VWA domain-containing protein [Acidobacteria bacterium]|nr:MAG: VWA domain-containing protein [Acidobacteriota bacterium]